MSRDRDNNEGSQPALPGCEFQETPQTSLSPPKDLNPPRLSIKNPPPTVRVHLSLCIISTHGIVMHFVQHGLCIYILPTMAPVDYFSCQYLHRHWHRHWHRHHIRPSHFSMLSPLCHLPFALSHSLPFSIQIMAIVAFYNVTGGPSHATAALLVIVRRVRQIKTLLR